MIVRALKQTLTKTDTVLTISVRLQAPFHVPDPVSLFTTLAQDILESSQLPTLSCTTVLLDAILTDEVMPEKRVSYLMTFQYDITNLFIHDAISFEFDDEWVGTSELLWAHRRVSGQLEGHYTEPPTYEV